MNKTIVYRCITAFVVLTCWASLSGCKQSASPQTTLALVAMESAQPVVGSAPSPTDGKQRELTPEEEAKAQAEIDALYKRLDAQAAAKHASQWQPPVEVQRSLEASAPKAQIRRTGCAKDFCRYVVAVKDMQAMQFFSQNFSIEGSILFKYPIDAPFSAIAYVFRPGADVSNL